MLPLSMLVSVLVHAVYTAIGWWFMVFLAPLTGIMAYVAFAFVTVITFGNAIMTLALLLAIPCCYLKGVR